MPVTKTAARALRSSKRKANVNTRRWTNVETLIRLAKKEKSTDSVKKASAALDRATKEHYIHQNKAARLKSSLSKLITK